MTGEDQKIILAQVQELIQDNLGQRVNVTLAHGLMNLIAAITNSRLDKPQAKETTNGAS